MAAPPSPAQPGPDSIERYGPPAISAHEIVRLRLLDRLTFWGRTVTVVPDLIAVLDAESAEPLTAEMLSYGQRVRVLGYSAAPIMRRPESLKVFGPRMFGIKEDFRGVETLIESDPEL